MENRWIFLFHIWLRLWRGQSLWSNLLVAWALLLISQPLLYFQAHFTFWLYLLGILHDLRWSPGIKLLLHFLCKITWYFPSWIWCFRGLGFHLHLNCILQCVYALFMILQPWNRLRLIYGVCCLLLLWLQGCCFIYAFWTTWLLKCLWRISPLLLLLECWLQYLCLVILARSLLSIIIAVGSWDSPSIFAWCCLVLFLLYSFIEILNPNVLINVVFVHTAIMI